MNHGQPQVIDLHCHILPAIDDGSPDIDTSLQMARMAYQDGTRYIACTPHIVPGKYNNQASNIGPAVQKLQSELDRHEIGITLAIGADIHLAPDIVEGLNSGRLPTLAGSRYFLFEPPHHVLPPNLVKFCLQILAAGYIPILTHPERLTWIEGHYDVICALDDAGALMQLTAGSVTGRLGKSAQHWSERMLGENRVDLIASDGHDTKNRPPMMSNAVTQIEQLLGPATARSLCHDVPKSILLNESVKKTVRTGSADKRKSKLKSSLTWF